MRWKGRRQSDNVEDRRGIPAGGVAAGGGAVGIIIVIIVMLLGGDPAKVLPPGGQPAGPQAGLPGGEGKHVGTAEEEELRAFVGVVLADTEDVWNSLFQREFGRKYPEPRMQIFTDATQSGCGPASAASGPFYCPADQKVYLDLSFFQELKTRFKAPGDFAVAYVVAHEVGHHIQKQLHYTDRVHGQSGRLSKAEYNKLSVRLELQADYLAGVWAHYAQRTKQILEPGDIEEALRAANAIGDDRLQKQATGYVKPDLFTHGTSAQRIRWFRAGFKTGDLSRLEAFFDMDYEDL